MSQHVTNWIGFGFESFKCHGWGFNQHGEITRSCDWLRFNILGGVLKTIGRNRQLVLLLSLLLLVWCFVFFFFCTSRAQWPCVFLHLGLQKTVGFWCNPEQVQIQKVFDTVPHFERFPLWCRLSKQKDCWSCHVTRLNKHFKKEWTHIQELEAPACWTHLDPNLRFPTIQKWRNRPHFWQSLSKDKLFPAFPGFADWRVKTWKMKETRKAAGSSNCICMVCYC